MLQSLGYKARKLLPYAHVTTANWNEDSRLPNKYLLQETSRATSMHYKSKADT